jgi:hypothetical protein
VDTTFGSPLFNNLPQDDSPVLAGGRPATKKKDAEGMPTGMPAASLRLCPCTPPLHPWCWQRGMCAFQRARTTCSETPRPTGRSRVDTAEVNSPSPNSCRVRLAGRGHRVFSPATRVRLPHATPANRSPRGAHASGAENGRNDWAAPEPVTGWMCFVSSVARVPACPAGSRGFDSRTRRHVHTSLVQWIQNTCLRSRRSHVRAVHEVPVPATPSTISM